MATPSLSDFALPMDGATGPMPPMPPIGSTPSDDEQLANSRYGIASGEQPSPADTGLQDRHDILGEGYQDGYDPQAEDEQRRLADSLISAAAAKSPLEKLIDWADPHDTPNIALELDVGRRGEIGMKVCEEYQIDVTSREEWLETAEKGLDMALQKVGPKSYPWPNACFSLDTDILTDRGWCPIGDVVEGDRVLSRALDGTAEYHPVTRTFRHTATHVVHFEGKSMDLMVTPNHKMLVETEYPGSKTATRRYKRRENTAFIPGTPFIYASEFLKRTLQFHYIPTTSAWNGETPKSVYGIDPIAYVRLIGWFVSEGHSLYCKSNPHTPIKSGETVDYGPTTSGFGISQSLKANPAKYNQIKRDIEACGFSYTAYENQLYIHARSVPDLMKAELRSLGRAADKHIPAHIMGYAPALLEQLLETMVAGDGTINKRLGRQDARSYFTISQRLADQAQIICQKIGLRGTILTREAVVGGVVNGRTIVGANRGYTVTINRKPRVRIATLNRKLVQYGKDVACVEVAPHHTVYVRRNGKAVWCGNSNVCFPLITQACDQFAARAYPAIISNQSVVKGSVVGNDEGVPAPAQQQDPAMMGQQPAPGIGDNGGPPIQQWLEEPGAKASRAARIGAHMSYQILEEMPEWEEDTDKLVNILPAVGCEFRKTFYDPSEQRPMSLRVPAKNIVVNYWARSVDSAPRITEIIKLYPYEIQENINTGFFLQDTYLGSTEQAMDNDHPVVFLEQHRRLDLDGDGYTEPYIVTVHQESMKVARIVARYEVKGIKLVEGTDKIAKIDPVSYYTKYDFLPNKEGGFYGHGFAHALKTMNEAINSTLNMLLDAGHLQNTGGGFIGKGLGMMSGEVTFSPGKFIQVNALGQDIRQAIVPMQWAGPSPVLFTLLGTLIEAGRDISSVKDVMTGEVRAQTMSPTVFMALVEQGLKVFTAIYKRIYRSLKAEFKKLYRLNTIYMDEHAEFHVGEEWQTVTKDDYRSGAKVIPVSDPAMVVDAQKMARTDVLAQFKDDPMMNGGEIRKRILEAANIENAAAVLKVDPAPNPELIVKSAQLEIQKRVADAGVMVSKADVLLKMSAAIKNMADADAAVNEQFNLWVQTQMQQLQQTYDQFSNEREAQANGITAPDQQPAGPTGNPGPQPGAMGAMAPPPNDAGVPPLLGGLPG